MKDIIEGFLSFQREAFPQRSELFNRPATSQPPLARQARLVTATWACEALSGE